MRSCPCIHYKVLKAGHLFKTDVSHWLSLISDLVGSPFPQRECNIFIKAVFLSFLTWRLCLVCKVFGLLRLVARLSMRFLFWLHRDLSDLCWTSNEMYTVGFTHSQLLCLLRVLWLGYLTAEAAVNILCPGEPRETEKKGYRRRLQADFDKDVMDWRIAKLTKENAGLG